MTVKSGAAIEHSKVKGIKARAVAIVDRYMSMFSELSNDANMLEIVATQLRIAAPQSYSQMSLNAVIKSRLQEMGVVNPINRGVPVCIPIDLDDPADIYSYSTSRYKTTMILLKSDLTIDGVTLFAGELLKVIRIAHRSGSMTVLNILSDRKYELDMSSASLQQTLKQAAFFYEHVLNISIGDAILQLDAPTNVLKVTEINDYSISFIDIHNQTSEVTIGSIEGRMMNLAYVAEGELAKAFRSDVTLIILDGDEKARPIKSFINDIAANTRELVSIFGVEKTLRKSVSIVCPTDMIENINAAIERSKKGNKGYIEWLIDELYQEWENQPVLKDNTDCYMTIYATPPLSKPHAFWISEEHYAKLKEFCDEHSLKVNPMALHLVMRDLVKRGLITLDPLLI